MLQFILGIFLGGFIALFAVVIVSANKNDEK